MASSGPPARVVVIAIGGASNSGKTTLCKHLRRILPQSVMLHQDDFQPPLEKIPMHPVHNVRDWDHPEGCMDWHGFKDAIRYAKKTGFLPPGHSSRDHLNEEVPVPIPDDARERWQREFKAVPLSTRYVLVEGFLVFWLEECYALYDSRIFVREKHDIIKRRREARSGYVLYGATTSEAHGQAPKDGDRLFWKDPPGYFDDIVWPAYLRSHNSLFIQGDVENGGPARDDICVLEGGDIQDMIERACKAVKAAI